MRTGRQRNTQTALQAFEAIERHPAAILEQGHHTASFGIVFLVLAGRLRRCLGREYFAAEVATKLLKFKDRGLQGGDVRSHAGSSLA